MASPGESAENQTSSAAGVVIVGGGFAGAATAAALARAGIASGVLLEREAACGTYASGRNAAIARQVESDPLLAQMAIRGVGLLRKTHVDGHPVLRQTGGFYLLHADTEAGAAPWTAPLTAHGVPFELLAREPALRRFPMLAAFDFTCAIYCPTDGIVDIHALLGDMLAQAKAGGFRVAVNRAAESLIVEDGAV